MTAKSLFTDCQFISSHFDHHLVCSAASFPDLGHSCNLEKSHIQQHSLSVCLNLLFVYFNEQMTMGVRHYIRLLCN